MLKKLMHSGLILLLVAGMLTVHAFAEGDKDFEKRADLAARFLVSCRAIIAQNQELFNNPHPRARNILRMQQA